MITMRGRKWRNCTKDEVYGTSYYHMTPGGVWCDVTRMEYRVWRWRVGDQSGWQDSVTNAIASLETKA